jgi:outer membrane protease
VGKILKLIALLFFLPVVSALSEESPISGSFRFNVGGFYGSMNEYVYAKGRAQEISRLEWEEHFVPYIEAAGEITFRNFFFDISILNAIPVKSGAIRDYDYVLPSSEQLSHFSEHEAWLDKHLELFAGIGYNFHFGKWSLSPSAGFMFRVRKWTAKNGYTQYPPTGQPWSEQVPKVANRGACISYEEEIWFPVVSLGADYRINKNWGTAISASWYPYLDVQTIDTHFLTKTVYYDIMKGGNGVHSELALLYYPRATDAMSFKFAFGFEGIYPQRGTTLSGKIGDDTRLSVSTGIQPNMVSNLFWFSIGVAIYPDKIWKRRNDAELSQFHQSIANQ